MATESQDEKETKTSDSTGLEFEDSKVKEFMAKNRIPKAGQKEFIAFTWQELESLSKEDLQDIVGRGLGFKLNMLLHKTEDSAKQDEISEEQRFITSNDIKVASSTEHSHSNAAIKPLKISILFGTYPLATFITFFLILCACGAGIYFSGKVNMVAQTGRDFLVYTDPLVQRNDAYNEAVKEISTIDLAELKAIRSTNMPNWMVQFLYVHKSPTGDLLTPTVLAKIKEFEDHIRKGEFKKWCLLDSTDNSLPVTNNQTCSQKAVISVLSLLSADVLQSESQIKSTMTVVSKGGMSASIGKEFPTQGRSSVLRSLFYFGAPLYDEASGKRFLNEQDRLDEQKEMYHTYLQKEIIDYSESLSFPEFDIYPFGSEVWRLKFSTLINGDTMFASGSVAFVFFYMAVHTRSLFVTFFGVLGVLFSFPLTMICYFFIYGIDFFQTLHMLTIFVILGIGADDIFVFVDAWNQSPAEMRKARLDPSDLVARVDWTYRRAAKAMFVTSFTTVVAFGATGLSSLMPISSFGIFAGTLVAMNYLIVITYFPPLIVLWERNIRYACRDWKTEREEKQQSIVNGDLSDKNKQKSNTGDVELEVINRERGDSLLDQVRVSVNRRMSQARQTSVQGIDDMFNATERFFYSKWHYWMKRCRYIILFIFLVWMILAAYFTSQLSSLTEQEKFLKDDSILQISSEVSNTRFMVGADGNAVKVDILWGIDADEPIDREGVYFFDPMDVGKVNFVPGFSIASGAAQQYILQICEELKESNLVLNKQLICFMEDYKTWRLVQNQTFPAVFSGDEKLQEIYFTQNMIEFLQLRVDYANMVGIDTNGIIKFVKLRAIIDLRRFLPIPQTRPKYDEWENWMQSKNREGFPVTMGKGMQFTSHAWGWMASEAAFFTNAIQGMLISISVAFLVLVVSTTNIVIAFYSTLTIAGIVLSVVSTMTHRGWELGVAESIAVVILVGFSVDYVVHLGNSYVEAGSHHTTRNDRMQAALREMGISVLAGGVTTFGSSLFLWGAASIFFLKFAWLMEMTVLFALLWSLCFFSALCYVAGPQGNTGSIIQYFKANKVVQ